uniref:Uncharacterized protein n=1 Tax=Candidatus Kentrum sp. FW TaxID=2126338 RepID=A0A450TLF9_9GAMM|nr:MAG: hypothetical protein BECKFW1821B_GA0114236_11466 [Candidatus Kentron sp. FW]
MQNMLVLRARAQREWARIGYRFGQDFYFKAEREINKTPTPTAGSASNRALIACLQTNMLVTTVFANIPAYGLCCSPKENLFFRAQSRKKLRIF